MENIHVCLNNRFFSKSIYNIFYCYNHKCKCSILLIYLHYKFLPTLLFETLKQNQASHFPFPNVLIVVKILQESFWAYIHSTDLRTPNKHDAEMRKFLSSWNLLFTGLLFPIAPSLHNFSAISRKSYCFQWNSNKWVPRITDSYKKPKQQNLSILHPPIFQIICKYLGHR